MSCTAGSVVRPSADDRKHVGRSNVPSLKTRLRCAVIGIIATFVAVVCWVPEASADVAEPGWVAPESFVFDGLSGGSLAEPVAGDELADGIRVLRDQHAIEIATPAAEAEREDSVDAYSGLGANATIELITDVFAEPLDALTTLPTDPLMSSETAPRFNAGSDTSARIDPPGDEDSLLVVSSSPLRNADDEIVSGELQADQDGFSPEAPLANVELPEHAAGQIGLSDVGVSFGFAGAAGSAGQLVDAADGPGKEMVLYPNTQTDTDTAITYTLAGVETFNYLRSAESPESFSLAYELPEGASLSPTADGGAIVLDGEGQDLVTVFPPYAVDAQGSDVPMTLSVEGDSIALEVPHRGKDFAYPIMVDPVQHVRSWWGNGASPGFEGWGFHQLNTANYNMSLDCPSSLASIDPCGGAGNGAGLYVSAVPTRYYASTAMGYWLWTVPGGPSSSITDATISSWRYRKGNPTVSQAFYQLGNSAYYFNEGGGGSGLYLNGATSGVKYLHFGLYNYGSAYTMPAGASNWRYARLAAYSANLTDGEAPSITMTGAPTGWLKENTNFTVTAQAADPGLGLGWIQAHIGGAWTNLWAGWCTGTYGAECPKNASPTLTFNTSGFASGVNGIYTRAIDIVSGTGHEAVSGFNFKVDKTLPSQTVTSEAVSGGVVGAREYEFEIDASDAHSGVVSNKILVNNSVVDSKSQTCGAGGCPLNSTLMADFGGLSDGVHQVKLVTTDGAGNTKTGSLSVSVDGTAPAEFDWTGNVLSEPESWLDPANDHVEVEAADPSSGVVNLELLLNGQSVAENSAACPSGACTLTLDEDLDLSELPAGEQTLTAIAIDRAGNESTENRAFFLDRLEPVVALQGLPPADGGRGMPAYTVEVDATDSRELVYESGVEEITVKIDGVAISTETDPCPAGDCALSDEVEIDASLLSDGSHDLRVEVVDRAGNEFAQEQTFETGVDDENPGLSVETHGLDNPNGVRPGQFVVDTKATDALGSGATSLVAKLDSQQIDSATQSCATGGCSLEDHISVDTSSLTDGTHELEIIATDAESNVQSKEIEFTVNRAIPEINLSGTLIDAFGHWILPGTKSVEVDATGYLTGQDLEAKLWINGVVADSDTVACLGTTSCNETLELETGFTGTTAGKNEVRVTVTNDGNTVEVSNLIYLNKQGTLSVTDSVAINDAFTNGFVPSENPFSENGGQFPLAAELYSGTGNADSAGSFQFEFEEETLDVLVGTGLDGTPELAPDAKRIVTRDQIQDLDQIISAEPNGLAVTDILRSDDAPSDLVETYTSSLDVDVEVDDGGNTVQLLDGSDPDEPTSLAAMNVRSAKDADGMDIPWVLARDHQDIRLELDLSGSVAWPVRIDRTWSLTGPLMVASEQSQMRRGGQYFPSSCRSAVGVPLLGGAGRRYVYANAVNHCNGKAPDYPVTKMTTMSCLMRTNNLHNNDWNTTFCANKTLRPILPYAPQVLSAQSVKKCGRDGDMIRFRTQGHFTARVGGVTYYDGPKSEVIRYRCPG